jgi:hypothetical protein
MTKDQADELAREAQSERVRRRDHALEEWNRWYDQRFPRRPSAPGEPVPER